MHMSMYVQTVFLLVYNGVLENDVLQGCSPPRRHVHTSCYLVYFLFVCT